MIKRKTIMIILLSVFITGCAKESENFNTIPEKETISETQIPESDKGTEENQREENEENEETIAVTPDKTTVTATFLNGKSFNEKLIEITTEYEMTAFNRRYTAPTPDDYSIVVSTENSDTDIWCWNDQGTVYWYTDADKIYLNEDTGNMFDSFLSLESLDFYGADFSRTKDFSGMFANCESLTKINGASSWETVNAEDFTQMFYHCTSLESLEGLGGWNTKSVANTVGMFEGCTALYDISALSYWNTVNIFDLSRMFAGCSSLEDITPIKNWDGLNFITLWMMFSDCISLKDADLSGWRSYMVEDTSEMFKGCSSLTSVNMSMWNMEKIKRTSEMFMDCGSLQNIILINWNVNSLELSKRMFYGCENLKNIYIDEACSDWSEYCNYVEDSSGMFEGCSSLKNWNKENKNDISNASAKNNSGYFTLLIS